MAVRLVVTFNAASGKGAELAQAMKARCEVSRQDAGCEQFEVFQSVSDPDMCPPNRDVTLSAI